jgi:hypothetical protein
MGSAIKHGEKIDADPVGLCKELINDAASAVKKAGDRIVRLE